MKKFLVAAAALAAMTSFATASERPTQPKKMTAAQMDKVTAGALINAVIVDVVDVNNNNVDVAIPVNAGVAIGILGTAGTVATQAGRIRQ